MIRDNGVPVYMGHTELDTFVSSVRCAIRDTRLDSASELNIEGNLVRVNPKRGVEGRMFEAYLISKGIGGEKILARYKQLCGHDEGVDDKTYFEACMKSLGEEVRGIREGGPKIIMSEDARRLALS